MMPADVQMTYGIFLCACTLVFPLEKLEQMIVMSLDDVTVIACAIWGGKYIRRASLSFMAVVWVSGTEQLVYC